MRERGAEIRPVHATMPPGPSIIQLKALIRFSLRHFGQNLEPLQAHTSLHAGQYSLTVAL